jgi:conjugal transfer pilus assembly protein TraA
MKVLFQKLARNNAKGRKAGHRTLARNAMMVGLLLAVLMISSILPGLALAGTADTEFQPMFQKVLDWTQGFLGKGLAVAAVLIGGGYSLYDRSIGGIAMGLVLGLAFAFLPGAIQGLVTATL